jgi:serine/threonine protein kinase
MIGEAIAHYRITAVIGKGGRGEVYRARDTKLDRDVAIKVCLKPSPAIRSGWRGSSARPRFWLR